MIKTLLIIGYLIMVPFFVFCQNWATKGTTWHYTRSQEYWFRPVSSAKNMYEHSSMTSLGDTVIDGIDCRILQVNNPDSCNPLIGNIYAYQENQKIYYYLQDSGYFTKLYDFSLQVGDSMKTMTRLGPITTYVDSIKILNIGDTTVQQQFIHYKTTGVMDAADRVFFSHPKNELFNIEGIGNSFNFFYWWFGLCHNVRVSNLRCFESENLNYHYSSEWISNCDSTFYYGENSIAEKEEFEIRLYPNPGTNELNLKTNARFKTISIYDVHGNLVFSSKFSKTLQLGHLPTGLYLILCQGEHARYQSRWLKN